jgi:hypothetical protein
MSYLNKTPRAAPVALVGYTIIAPVMILRGNRMCVRAF